MVKDLRGEIRQLPRALAALLEKKRSSYEEVIHAVRWANAPIRVVASGREARLAEVLAYGFEHLAGWPVVVESPSRFVAYHLAAVQPRCVVWFLASPEAEASLLRAAMAARSRGATILVFSEDETSALAAAAQGVFHWQAEEMAKDSPVKMILQQAVLCYLTLLAAKILRPQTEHLEAWAQDFARLPGQIDWVAEQLAGAVKALAAEMPPSGVTVLGAGYFHAAALAGVGMVRDWGGPRMEALEAAEYKPRGRAGITAAAPYVILSNHYCRLKKDIAQVAHEIDMESGKLLCITDAADRNLTEKAAVAILLPEAREAAGAILALTVFAWAASLMAQRAM
jgi:DNA-binding MurR/RpiR family transcriptional regulator